MSEQAEGEGEPITQGAPKDGATNQDAYTCWSKAPGLYIAEEYLI